MKLTDQATPASRLSRLNSERFSSSTPGGIPFFFQFQTRWRLGMPSFSAKAVGPPAFAMTSFDSSGVMPPCTPWVYSRQAGVYQKRENTLYGAQVPTDKELCDYIFNLIDTRRVSQVELAEACGVTRAAVNNWKANGIVPADNHAAIAKKLGTTVDGLLTLGRTAPVLSLTEEQLSNLPHDTQAMVRQAVQMIETMLASSSGRFDMREANKAPTRNRR
jgi:predicted XRE-type DNA-binding protein